MPKVIGGLLALIALSASLLAGVDPWGTLLRGFIAYVVGLFLAQLWYVFFTIRVTDQEVAIEETPQTEAGQG